MLAVLQIGLFNTSYLTMRSYKGGVDEKPICRAFAYLILCALDVLPAENVTRLINDTVYRGQGEKMPDDVKKFLLMPIADQLLSEMQDVCSSDCSRISVDRRAFTDDKDEVEDYWLRLDPEGVDQTAERKILRIESFVAPCAVGFPVDKDHHCPLFGLEPTVNNVGELLSVIKRVAAFRKAQAAEKQEASKLKLANAQLK